MKILLDTHIVCWQYYEPQRLPEMARRLMVNADAVYVSSATVWEIAIKARLGKINADPHRIAQQFMAGGLIELPVYPFDRILIAQAISEPLHLVTVDSQLKQYSELVIQV
jgi:PIN domain nuclease of toxin-antitoxin system